MKCACKDWEENQPVIDNAIIMSHHRGYGDIKKSFTYCPWCGKVLEQEKHNE